jgi:tetratricopeptide (TPR) repeat protein
MRAAVSLLLVTVLAGCSLAAAPPARLTAEQAEKLAQSQRWLHQANTHFRAGEIDKAITAIHKGLALERSVFGQVRAAALPWLQGQAQLLERCERFADAISARRELLQRRQELHGRGDWRVTDARLDLEDTRLLARLVVKQRQHLRQAEQWNEQVFGLWQQGRSKDALPLAEKALAARRTILGEKHRHTAQSGFNLGAQHAALHHVEQARRYYEQALYIRKEVVGEKHPDYALSLNNLATLYQDMGDHKAALPLFQQALQVYKAALGEKHPSYAQSLNNLAALFRDTGDHQAALPLYKQALQINKEAVGEKHPLYAISLHNLATLYQDRGEYQAALPLFQQALQIKKAVRGEKHPDYAGSLNNLAGLYKAMGDHQAALRLCKQALQVCKAALGEKHPHYATSLNNLAVLYKEMGDHQAALPLCKQALRVSKAARGEKHPDHANSLNSLARLYQDMGDHQAALPLYQQALQIRKATLGVKHPDYALSLNNLAMLYLDMGDHQAALLLCKQALQVCKASLGEKHPKYALSLNNLAMLYKDMGDHQAALPLYQQALQVRKAVLGEKHPDYARSLNNLAMLYLDMGDLQATLPLCKQALRVCKAVLGEKHPDYAITLNNLAGLYMAMGDHQAALPLYQQALQVRKSVLEEKHPLYATSLNNLAGAYKARGDHQEALRLCKQALRVYKAALGEKHPSYATSLTNLAGFYHDMGDYQAALPLLRQALQVRKAALGEKHPDHARSLAILAMLYQGMKQPQQAQRLSEQALAITRANLLLSASVQSERQQLAAAGAVRYQLDLRLSLPDPPMPGQAGSYPYQHVLGWKGAVFLHQQQRRQFACLLGSSRAEVRTLVEQLQQTTRHLAALTLAPVDARTAAARRQQAEKLTHEKENLESQLSRLSSTFREEQKHADLNPTHIQQTLPADAVLVDFLFYEHQDHTQTDHSKRWQRRLSAWVVRRDRSVVRLDLGPAVPIEQAAFAWRQALARRGDATAASKNVSRLLWQPLAKHLERARTVLISPDGVLGTVPFPALPGRKEGTYIIEDVAVAVVPVPQLLPQMLAPVPKDRRLKPSLLLVGDVNFDSTETAAASADDRGAPRGGFKAWGKLEATSTEADAVRGLFSRLFKGGTVTELRGGEARKAAVRQALSKHRYAHLATHGFFAPPELKSALADKRPSASAGLFGREGVTGWHPLLLSGLALAGANKEAKPDEEDGILTALEVSEMDLASLELAVLSACETGLGRRAAGEGLLGLQRAFAVTGCRSVVASLWQVSDQATQSLMAAFYRAYWGEKVVSLVEALRQAQLTLLRDGLRGGLKRQEKPKEKDNRLPPFYWAAFVLSGDWR